MIPDSDERAQACYELDSYKIKLEFESELDQATLSRYENQFVIFA